MALRKFALTLVALMTLVVGRQGQAQEYLPIVDPLEFEHDFSWFDPIHPYDLMDVKPEKRAATGFYGAYDRMVLSVTRPEALGPTDPGPAFGDWGWGNRFDFGYMMDNDHGWSFTYFDLSGPNSYEETFRTRVDLNNGQEPQALINSIVQPPGFTGTGNGFTPVTTTPSELNDFQYGYRLYRERDSLNVASLNGLEMNKTWRLKPYEHGGILEPMIGLRYMRFSDLDLDSTYLGPTPVAPTGPVVPIEGTVTESIRELSYNTNNDCFGGQLGFRYFRYQGRWTLSTDFRVMVMENFWKQVQRDYVTVTEYGGIGTTPLVYEYVQTDQRAYYHDNDTVVGFDLRAEAAYQVTKSFAVRAGLQMIDFETGIMRGNAIANNLGLNFRDPQDVQLVGFTFGMQLNR